MAQQATMVRVMIASPGDVPQERQIVRAVIHEWNAIHAQDRSTVLLPIGWETHSTPEMNDRPQAIITKQILQDCDLLVAVFWTRLGSPTGVSASGTVEEIDEHLQAGKPAMLYFSSAPVQMRSVDQANYAALMDFREQCLKRGLIQEYESLGEFRELFARQLAQTVIRKFGVRGEAEERGPPTKPAPLELSSDAQLLLTTAAEASSGVVMMVGTLGGTIIQAGSTSFASEGSPRDDAKWRAAVEELREAALIEDRTGKGELFFVTNRGYDFAQMLGSISPDPEQND